MISNNALSKIRPVRGRQEQINSSELANNQPGVRRIARDGRPERRQSLCSCQPMKKTTVVLTRKVSIRGKDQERSDKDIHGKIT